MHRRKIGTILCTALCAALFAAAIGGSSALGASQSQIDALERQKEELVAQKEETAGKMQELEQQQATAMERKAVLEAYTDKMMTRNN